MNGLKNVEIRGWNSFFDFGTFGAPAGLPDAQSRLDANVNYYLGNYLVITGVLFLLSLYVNPYLLVPILVTGGVGAAMIFVLPQQGIRLPKQQQLGLVAGIALLSLFMTGTLSFLLYLVLVSVGVTVAHAVLRKNSIKAKANNVFSELKSDVKAFVN